MAITIVSKCKAKKCRWCGVMFFPWVSTQVCCKASCALDYITEKQNRGLIRDQRAANKIKRKDIRKRKEALRPKSWYVKKAQASFNAYIRKRDEGNLCISCQKPPKKINCGHYKTTAARQDLRFHPFNGNLQCEHCNSWKSGAIDLYRPNLVKKIGESNVLWLESHQPPQNLTVDDLIDIDKHYKEQLSLIKGDL